MSRWACTRFAFGICCSIRSYVSSSDSGNSARTPRTLDGKHCRRTSSWQTTQRNLQRRMRNSRKQITVFLHAISLVRKCLNNQLLVPIPPSPHVLIGVNDSADELDNILFLSTSVMKGNAVRWRCQGLKGSSDVDLGSTSDAKMKSWKVQCDQFLDKI